LPYIPQGLSSGILRSRYYTSVMCVFLVFSFILHAQSPNVTFPCYLLLLHLS
jgi:hypothetical protein